MIIVMAQNLTMLLDERAPPVLVRPNNMRTVPRQLVYSLMFSGL